MDPIYVTGHRNPDTDSIVSAMAYAALRNALGDREFVPARLGHISDETQLVLARFGFEPPLRIQTMRTQVRDLAFDTPPALSSAVTLSRAWDTLRSNRAIPALPVTNDDGSLYGMLSPTEVAAYDMNTVSEPVVQTSGKIPEADIVLLDEIFKCNDGVLNSLLTALNERKYTNEGHTYPIPTISFVAASNEIPNFSDPQEKILEALYDRLELKVVTANIEDRDNRLTVLKNKQNGVFGQISSAITLEELVEMQREVAAIPVPDAANELADDILCELRKSMAVSDRKYLGYYPIAQAKAWLSGHDKVEASDLLALKNYLWRLPADREKVENVLNRLCINPMQEKVNGIREMALDSQAEFTQACGDSSRADLSRKAFIKLRGELIRLYQKQCELHAAAQSDSETALADSLLADLEDISRKAHEQTGFTYTPLSEIAALN